MFDNKSLEQGAWESPLHLYQMEGNLIALVVVGPKEEDEVRIGMEILNCLQTTLLFRRVDAWIKQTSFRR